MPYIYVIHQSKRTGYFFERFPMPYLSLLNKIQQGGVYILNVLKALHEKGSFSYDCILMIDEMYLRKSAQYQSGEHVGGERGRNH